MRRASMRRRASMNASTAAMVASTTPKATRVNESSPGSLSLDLHSRLLEKRRQVPTHVAIEVGSLNRSAAMTQPEVRDHGLLGFFLRDAEERDLIDRGDDSRAIRAPEAVHEERFLRVVEEHLEDRDELV